MLRQTRVRGGGVRGGGLSFVSAHQSAAGAQRAYCVRCWAYCHLMIRTTYGIKHWYGQNDAFCILLGHPCKFVGRAKVFFMHNFGGYALGLFTYHTHTHTRTVYSNWNMLSFDVQEEICFSFGSQINVSQKATGRQLQLPDRTCGFGEGEGEIGWETSSTKELAHLKYMCIVLAKALNCMMNIYTHNSHCVLNSK